MYGQVIGYAYAADVHCISCAQDAFHTDSPEYQTDNEGNPVTAYLSGQDTNDLADTLVCGDCFAILHEVE